MFNTITDVKQLARDTGSHWFDRDTMRFFGTRIESPILFGQYFVTSEQADDPAIWDGKRRYSVRKATYTDGRLEIDTIGEFGQYDNKHDAINAINN